MNLVKKILFAIFPAVLAGAVSLCSLNGPNTAGTATETENVAVAGELHGTDGRPAVGATVYLRPADYLPNISAKVTADLSFRSMDTTITDSLGKFVFDSIAVGTYALECLDGEDGNGALIESVTVIDPDSTVELATDTLKPLGSIAGQIQLPESLDASRIRVMVYGLDRVTIPDSTGDYIISGLAEGAYTLRFQIPGGQGMDIDSVAVVSDSTTRPPAVILPGADKIFAYKVSSAITIDGILNETNWAAVQGIHFEKPGVTENQVTVKALWDSTNLYISYEVEDTLLGMDSLSQWNRGDAAEIFLDPEHNAFSGMDTFDLQFVINIRNEVELVKEPFHQVTSTVISLVDTTAKGYNIEIAIPWTLIGSSPQGGLVMGVLFGNDDRDAGRAVQFSWLNKVDVAGNWRDASLWGDLILK